jgi:hypothetical protein
MKTSMELALARIELLYGMKPDDIHWEMFKNDCIEKEKEQSINLIKQTCMFMGASIIDIEISKMEFEDIYNNYNNQNK